MNVRNNETKVVKIVSLHNTQTLKHSSTLITILPVFFFHCILFYPYFLRINPQEVRKQEDKVYVMLLL